MGPEKVAFRIGRSTLSRIESISSSEQGLESMSLSSGLSNESRMPERLFLRLPDDPPCAPGTTVPASTLREFPVPAPLRSVVTHVTSYEERFAPGAESS